MGLSLICLSFNLLVLQFPPKEKLSRSLLGLLCKSLAKKVNVQRIDQVSDTYDPLSIKGPTRIGRGCETAHRHPFNLHSALPQDLSSFFKNDNKTGLNKLISDYCLQPHLSDSNLEIVVTYHHKLKSKSDGIKEVFE